MNARFELLDANGDPIILNLVYDENGALFSIDDGGITGAAAIAKAITTAVTATLDVKPIIDNLIGAIVPVFAGAEITDVAIEVDFAGAPTMYVLRARRPDGVNGEMPNDQFAYNFITAMARCWFRLELPSQFAFETSPTYLKIPLTISASLALAVLNNGSIRMTYDTGDGCLSDDFASGVLLNLGGIGAGMTNAAGVAGAIRAWIVANLGAVGAQAYASGDTVDIYYPLASLASPDGLAWACMCEADASAFTVTVTDPTLGDIGVTKGAVACGVSLP